MLSHPMGLCQCSQPPATTPVTINGCGLSFYPVEDQGVDYNASLTVNIPVGPNRG